MSYPYRNPRVQLDLPQPDVDSRLILNHETGRYLRLGLREFGWLSLLNGQIHRRDVAAALGEEETLTQEALRRLEAAKLICFSEEPVTVEGVQHTDDTPPETRRVEWANFGQLRIHLGRPKALLERLAPLTRTLLSKPAVAAGILFSLFGVALALSQSSDFATAMREFEWTGWQALAIITLLFTTTFIHELGHAVVCHHFGAPVRSLGIMFFYFQPAAYADITDSWQLKNRWHRVAIAFAGVYVQAIIATLAMIAWSVLRLSGQRADLLIVFVTLNAVIIAFNVLPFTKLDGYWVLSNVLGIANLRDRAMEWTRASMTSLIRRRPLDPKKLRYAAIMSMSPLGRALLGAFGISAMIFGFAMWVAGLGFLFRTAGWLELPQTTSFFAVGGVVVFLAIAYGVSRILGARRAIRRAQAAPAPRPAVPATVTYAIDPKRPIRLNPHLSAVDNGDGGMTFAWSTPDALTVQAPQALFDALPTLREGTLTLGDIKQSPLWCREVEQALQRLWHDRHLRYSSDWDTPAEHVRYSRQLGWFSMNAQARGKEVEALARLKNASVTILGVGGLGTHVAWNLAACGVGELHLVDGDTIELSNLNRQLFYTPDDIGQRKVDVAAERLKQFNPELRIRTTHKFLTTPEDFYDVIEGSSFVVRAVDSPAESLQWVNEACVRRGIPYSGAGFFPQGTVVGPTVVPGESPCLACNAPATAPRFDRGTGGTLAPFVFATSGLLACEVVTYLAKLGPVQTLGKMLAVNAPALNFNFRELTRNVNCPVCGQEERKVSA